MTHSHGLVTAARAMVAGAHPRLAFAIVGAGAAAHAPALHGLIAETVALAPRWRA